MVKKKKAATVIKICITTLLKVLQCGQIPKRCQITEGISRETMTYRLLSFPAFSLQLTCS